MSSRINMTGLLLASVLVLICQPAGAGQDPFVQKTEAVELLKVDEAFRLGSYREGDTTLVFWHVMPGYFLYRDKFFYRVDGEDVPPELPEGELRQDEIFGEVQVLEGLIEISVPVTGAFEVLYQGCAEEGFCYPPQKRGISSGNMASSP